MAGKFSEMSVMVAVGSWDGEGCSGIVEVVMVVGVIFESVGGERLNRWEEYF